MTPTIVACATPRGGCAALLRLSGPQACDIAGRAGVPLAAAWTCLAGSWRLGPGPCPCRSRFMPGPRSATGHDLVEISLPGARDLVDLGLDALLAHGASAAGPGDFTRQALANGRITLDQAESILALHQARDEQGVAEAIERLRGGLGREVAEVRSKLLELRARLEAGLDFAEEPDVVSLQRQDLVRDCGLLAGRIARWSSIGDTVDGIPQVCLVGPANAGKSALFAALTGAHALISPVPGTTRDWLEEAWDLGGRRVTLVDTAGWLDADGSMDRASRDAAQRVRRGAALILACSAPDAPLPADPGLDMVRAVIVATKSDAGPADPRAEVVVSAIGGIGLDALRQVVAARLAGSQSGGRQARALAEARQTLLALAERPPAEDLLVAEELGRIADILGGITGATTSDEVLVEIFARFCVGK